MPKPHRCHLTTKDFSLLKTLREREIHSDDAFLRLLRQKLSSATVVFREDVDPQVATIDSRVDFSVHGRPSDSRILIHDREHTVPGLCLPITTLRGLALLGMTAGDTVVIERPDGTSEELRLDRVAYQPEAHLAHRLSGASAATTPPRREGEVSVVAFPARRRPASGLADAPTDPDGDDPGPRAA